MQVTLEVLTGPDVRRSVAITPGPAVIVGRKAPSHFVLEGDRTLSRVHFSVECDGTVCTVRDLGSLSGIVLNGTPVKEARAVDGDVINAGSTAFIVRVEGAASANRAPRPFPSLDGTLPVPSKPKDDQGDDPGDSLHDRVVKRLRRLEEPLFAVLDAARDPLVLARLIECKERHQSLYSGLRGDQLAEVAPYLVELPRESSLIETLVRDGWGQSWGIFLVCGRPFEEVRKHLRRFLRVKTEDSRFLYFRYYDPRVLRIFLPSCTETELKELYGPVRSFLMEAEDPQILQRFEMEGPRLRQQSARLLEPTPVVSSAV